VELRRHCQVESTKGHHVSPGRWRQTQKAGDAGAGRTRRVSGSHQAEVGVRRRRKRALIREVRGETAKSVCRAVSVCTSQTGGSDLIITQ
jgi:hypothetical protein